MNDRVYTYNRIKEIAQCREVSQNPRLQKGFERLLLDSKKSIQRLDKELIKLEEEEKEQERMIMKQA